MLSTMRDDRSAARGTPATERQTPRLATFLHVVAMILFTVGTPLAIGSDAGFEGVVLMSLSGLVVVIASTIPAQKSEGGE
jgi:hypothetical protein